MDRSVRHARRRHVLPLVGGALTLVGAVLVAPAPAAAQTVFSCSKPDAISLARKLVRDHFQTSTGGGPFRIGNSLLEPERRQTIFLSWGVKQEAQTTQEVSGSFGGKNLAHIAFLGPYDYWLDWHKTGSAARLQWCNYVIKAQKDKARYMAENSYVFLSEEWKDGDSSKVQQRVSLSTRGRTSVGAPPVDVTDAVRVTMLILSPDSAIGSGSYSLTITKKDKSQPPP